MTVIYVHGVKVRSTDHGEQLAKPFQRWLGPKLSVNNAAAGYEPVYWGDLATRFLWDLASRPKTPLLRMGGQEPFAGLGSLREAASQTPIDVHPEAMAAPGPVLDRPAVPEGPVTEPLSFIARDRRADFLADLYLVCRPGGPGEDAIAEAPEISGIAAAAAIAAEQWDRIADEEINDDSRAQRLLAAVDAALRGDVLISMGGVPDWMTNVGETLRRAAAWPGDAVSTIFAETRPILNEFVAYFVGDVFTYLTARGDANRPGEIPKRIFAALRRAQARKAQTGERIVVVSHSMGGQLVYDAATYFANHDPTLGAIEIDHWITCGSQVSLFAEMRLFLEQGDLTARNRLPRPARVKKWTNYYDPNDLVGFIMEPVFEGVKDQAYDTGYGLALAHTGFLARPSFFQAMADIL